MMAAEVAPQKRQSQQHAQVDARRKPLLDVAWRLGAWGGTALLSVAAVTIIMQTDSGSERLQSVLASPAEAARPIAVAPVPPRAAEIEAATRVLDAQVRSLSADRDRLVARLASLERHLDDVTGSIQPAVQPVPAPAPAPASPPAIASVLPRIATLLSPPVPPIVDPLASPPGSEVAGAWPEIPEPQAQPDPETGLVPLPPPRTVASLPNPPATVPSPAPAASKTEYGIELATGTTIDVLRTRWASVKANFGPLLTGLQPVAVRDRRPGTIGYRLVAGPLPNYTAAKQVCARFTDARMACRPAKFDGETIVQR
jgi:hypothetical protein